MAVGIYKKGQGYWTRVMTGIAAGLLIIMGAAWMWETLEGFPIGDIEPTYTAGAGAVIFFAIFGIIVFHLVARRHKTVDFMIATEGEMKKVNWSTRREIFGSTWVVIGLTVFIAIICFGFDRMFQYIFTLMKVLEVN
jgi:preprotein translocase SecE subunit